MTLQEEIYKLEKRKEMALFQRKITTCLLTVMEYDQELNQIEIRIEQLLCKLKKNEKSTP